MSRSGYSDDCDDTLQFGRWRAQVKSAIRGKRGQAFLKDLVAALEAMPKKRLITNDLVRENGEVCALGAVCVVRGIDTSEIDPDDYEIIGDKLGIAHQMVCEIEFENDEQYSHLDPESRWQKMHDWAKSQLREHATPAARVNE